MGDYIVILRYLLSVACFLFVTSQEEPLIATLKSTSTTESSPIAVSSNDTTHMGREHMIKINKTKQNQAPTVKNDEPKPPEFEIPEKNDGKKSVGKKGVPNPVNVTVAPANVTTSPTKKVMKPTLTEAEEDTGDVPIAPKNDTQNHEASMESLIEKGNKTDYVVPIVVVILSVPLVAIIFSVLYKRGTEWWQHRHYRRMDFLIEGMYNN